MASDTEFNAIIFTNFTARDIAAMTTRQTDAFISDAVDSLAGYVASIGEARINGGWCFS